MADLKPSAELRLKMAQDMRATAYAAGYRAGLEAATAEAKRVGDRARAFAALPDSFNDQYHVGRGTAASEIAAVIAALPIPEAPHD